MNYNSKYVVRLTLEEREELEQSVRRGKVAAAKRMRAHVLLKADAGPEGSGPADEQVAAAIDVAPITVHRVRKAYVEQGLAAAIERNPAVRHKPRKLDGAQEARLVAVACSPAPEGHARWTLRMLADKLVELEVVDSVSRECVRQTLKKTTSSRG
jgi:transposase